MAVLFSQTKSAKTYEVRSAGHSLRLYTNGVFHSQYNSVRPFMGHVWDLMALPVLLLPAHRPPRVLVLGVGGGAVIRQMQALRPDCEITGVDIDPVHLRLARKFFGVSAKKVTLECADAIDWVRNNKQVKYDLIVDDLFGDDTDCPGQPERAVKITADWLACLKQLVAPAGVLVFNTESPAKMRAMAALAKAETDNSFAGLCSLTLRQYQNAVAVLSRNEIKPRKIYSLIDCAEIKMPRKNGLSVYQIRDCTRLLG